MFLRNNLKIENSLVYDFKQSFEAKNKNNKKDPVEFLQLLLDMLKSKSLLTFNKLKKLVLKKKIFNILIVKILLIRLETSHFYKLSCTSSKKFDELILESFFKTELTNQNKALNEVRIINYEKISISFNLKVPKCLVLQIPHLSTEERKFKHICPYLEIDLTNNIVNS
jgi:hypothetical protein